MSRTAVLCGLAATALADTPTSAPSSVHFNIEGGPLQRCSGSGHALTGWLRNGHCTDRNDDAGSHHICIDMKSTVDGSPDKNFCTQTGQPNWCDDQMPCDPFPPTTYGNCPVKNWCVCQWAFRKYIAAAGGCDHIQHIVCDAINMVAITAYKAQLEKNPSDSLTKNAYDCLVQRCNVLGESKAQVVETAVPSPAPLPPPTSSPSSVHFNIEGKPLERCSRSGHALTGWLRNGYCTDRNDDAGSHHICIDMKSTVDGSPDKNFCTQTGQPNWCDEQMPCDPFPPVTHGSCPVTNWCVCQWAFRKYIAAAGGCDHIQHIECDAINMVAITAYKAQLEKNPSDTLTKNAYDCLVQRCNVEGESKPTELQRSVVPATAEPTPAPVLSTPAPVPTTPAPIPATNEPETLEKKGVGKEPAGPPSVFLTHEPVTVNKATTHNTAPKLGDSADEGTGSTGVVTMVIAGVLGFLALTAGVAAVVVSMSKTKTARTRKEVEDHLDLSKHLPEHDETPKGSVADIALDPA